MNCEKSIDMIGCLDILPSDTMAPFVRVNCTNRCKDLPPMEFNGNGILDRECNGWYICIIIIM
jgi:hypothetical protein